MTLEVRVPSIGDSISEVQIVQWYKQEGEWIDRDENLVELETDKATMQLPAPAAGRLSKQLHAPGKIVPVGELIAYLDEGAQTSAPSATPATVQPASVQPAMQAGASPSAAVIEKAPAAPKTATAYNGEPIVMPAAQHALAAHGIAATDVKPSGPGGRLLKEDVLRYVEAKKAAEAKPGVAPVLTQPEVPLPVPSPAIVKPLDPADPPGAATVVVAATTELMPAVVAQSPKAATSLQPSAATTSLDAEVATGANTLSQRLEEVVPMTMIRRRIAKRLVDAQQQAALLTTFNEIDMHATMDVRKRYKDSFQERHSVKLGFMSFFVKASIEALKRFPAVNAEVRGDSIVYRNYFDIGIAVGGGRGLVVPVLRNAERMSFADVEITIENLARRARENTIKPEELQGGTFTITNGGIYGSLLSTPIVNPPQSGILGLHAIQDRPVARDGQVVIRPMMYIALTYDHRIVDGREAVGFLRTIKEIVEDPARLILEI